MARPDRLLLIRRLQDLRHSHVVSYITSTRPNLEVQMAMDSVRRIFDHVRAIGRPKDEVKIDLFLHSNGGDGTVPWRLVTLLREFDNRLAVLVPFRAFSAATLTALGADAVVMHPMGMLGPTDATVANDFNPSDPLNPARKIGISVEDVAAFITLVREDAGIQHEDQLVEVIRVLSEKVHPLALGNVKRSMSQSRMMARKLLSHHMDAVRDSHKIDELVDKLTSKMYYHGHPINRSEAKEEVGLSTVEIPSPEVEAAMWNLFLDYENDLEMESPFDAAAEFLSAFPAQPVGTTDTTPTKTAKLAIIESLYRTDTAEMRYELVGTKNPAGATQVSLIKLSQRWVTDTAGAPAAIPAEPASQEAPSVPAAASPSFSARMGKNITKEPSTPAAKTK